MIVSGPGGPPAPAAPRRASGGAAFRVGDPPACEPAPRPSGAEPPAAPACVLALQEADAEPARDRAARRRAALMLDELASLQRALLAGSACPGPLARLASLAAGAADASGAEGAPDPGLRAAAAAVALRARIELARAESAR